MEFKIVKVNLNNRSKAGEIDITTLIMWWMLSGDYLLEYDGKEISGENVCDEADSGLTVSRLVVM